MIRSFKHKGLERLYLYGDTSKINSLHERKLQMILARLDAAHQAEDMRLPGFDFHRLIGDMREYFSVSVSKNWRLIFKFDGTDI